MTRAYEWLATRPGQSLSRLFWGFQLQIKLGIVTISIMAALAGDLSKVILGHSDADKAFRWQLFIYKQDHLTLSVYLHYQLRPWWDVIEDYTMYFFVVMSKFQSILQWARVIDWRYGDTTHDILVQHSSWLHSPPQFVAHQSHFQRHTNPLPHQVCPELCQEILFWNPHFPVPTLSPIHAAVGTHGIDSLRENIYWVRVTVKENSRYLNNRCIWKGFQDWEEIGTVLFFADQRESWQRGCQQPREGKRQVCHCFPLKLSMTSMIAETCMKSDRLLEIAMLATSHISTGPSPRSLSVACSWFSFFSTMTSLAFFILSLIAMFMDWNINVWFPTQSSSSLFMSCQSWPSLFTLSVQLTILYGS